MRLCQSAISVIFFSYLGDCFGSLRYFFLIGDIFFNKLPATDDRGCFTALFDVIVVEYQIYMDNGKEDKEPHQEMVDLACHQIAAHQRDGPGKQLGEDRLAHLGIQSETCNTLQQECPERTEVDQACQRSMADAFYWVVLYRQDADVYYFQNFLLL